MKKKIIILFGTTFFLVRVSACAQDSTKHSALKRITKTNEQADKLKGKEIKQQSLSNKKFTKLDTAITNRPIKNTTGKKRHKRS
jgi:hypothetical protein